MHRRRLVAWCSAQGGVPRNRVSADGRDVEIDRDERRSTVDVDDSRSLWVEHKAAKARQVGR